MSKTHTHRGHCQVCGRIQAVQNVTGEIAKHGYTVDSGYFAGTCAGSGERSLHVRRHVTDGIIAMCTKDAAAEDTIVAALKDGTNIPKECGTGRIQIAGGKMIEIKVSWEDATPYQRRSEVERRIYRHEAKARFLRSHVEMLTQLAKEVHGTEEVPVAVKSAPLAVGDVTTRGTVLEIADRIARGCGPHMNGRQMPHARLTGASGKDYWWPVRTLRRAK